MLATEQKIVNNLTYFNLPELKKEGWYVDVTRNGKVIKSSYALTKEDADLVRTMWINMFWGNILN